MLKGWRRYPTEQHRQLFRSGYERLKGIHKLKYAHRDVQSANVAVRAVRDAENKLVPSEPLDAIWIDCGDATRLGTVSKVSKLA